MSQYDVEWDALDLPKHKRLQLDLEEKIRMGEYPPGSRMPTEKELMAEYGLSYATVSRAVRELAKAGLVTRVRKRGTFVSDSPAQFTNPFAGPESNTLALFHGRLETGFHPFFTGLVDGFIRAAGEHEMSMKFVTAPEGDLGMGADFRARHGIAGFAVTQVRKSELLGALEARIPVVCVSGFWPTIPVDRVCIKHEKAQRAALQALRDHGHRQIAVIDRHHRGNWEELVAEVFDCLPSKAPITRIMTSGYNEAAARRALAELRSAASKPTAVFVVDDFVLLNFMRCCLREGIDIPGDFSVVGRGTSSSGLMLGPDVAMIEQEPEETAKAAVALLMDQIQTGRKPGETVNLRSRFVARGSVGPAPIAPDTMIGRKES